MVMVPMLRQTVMALAEWLKKGKMRANMYTPAATMVAECSSALTGVGPSMASGSQVSSGNCALLPMTPPKMSRAETVSRTGESRSAACGPFMSRIFRLPKWMSTTSRPRKKAMSPKRVMTKAFFPASLALNFSYQNPIRR